MIFFKTVFIFAAGFLWASFFLYLFKKGIKRNMRSKENEIKVRLSNQELEHLNDLVKKSKLSRESYLRMLINGLIPRASPSEELIDTILLLRNISNDIYQISINNSSIQNYQEDFELLQDQINQIMILIRQPIDITTPFLETKTN